MEPAGRRPRCGFCLTSGLEILDAWSQSASQAELNIVNQVLFAVTDLSVFTRYQIVDDVTRTTEFFVLAQRHLAVKIRVHGLNSFGIVYIGPACAAPGLDQAAPEVGSSMP
jgi:hypothetical protein